MHLPYIQNFTANNIDVFANVCSCSVKILLTYFQNILSSKISLDKKWKGFITDFCMEFAG